MAHGVVGSVHNAASPGGSDARVSRVIAGLALGVSVTRVDAVTACLPRVVVPGNSEASGCAGYRVNVE